MKREIKKKHVFTGIFFVVFLFSIGYMNGEETGSENKLNKAFISQFGRDIKEVVVSPGHWRGKDFLRLSAVLGTGALLFCFDDSIQEWVRENKTTDSEDVAGVLTNLGDGTFLGVLLVSSYLSGEIFNSDQLRKVGLLGAESFIITAILVNVLKFTVGRARPYADETSLSFRPFALSSRYFSFPSGHATSAFSVATVIAEHSEKLWVDVLVYSLAGLAAATRVHEDKHWLSDVFIGSVLGYLVGKKISRLHRNGFSERINVGFALTPRYQAMTFSYSF